jgi:hydrogenase maturation protease
MRVVQPEFGYIVMAELYSALSTFHSASPSILIIGIGNTLRGDDGVGIAAAESLEQSLSADAARIIATHQLLPELAEPISRCDLVLFIDADATLAAGEHRLTAIEPAASNGRAMGHHQSPAGLLRMALELYGRCPRAQLHSIGGEDFGCRIGLSDQASAGLKKALAEIVDGALAIRL